MSDGGRTGQAPRHLGRPSTTTVAAVRRQGARLQGRLAGGVDVLPEPIFVSVKTSRDMCDTSL